MTTTLARPVPASRVSSGVAQRPPLGWNSFDCFGWAVTEDEILANAEVMARRLKPFGWDYVVLDFCWYTEGGDANPNPHQSPDFTPRLNMDAYGRLLPDPVRFPSSARGGGLKSLADRIHAMGLRFGLHAMRGIPRQAVAANTPILGGGGACARDVAVTDNTCPWLNYMNGLDMARPGAQAYLDSLLALYAEWGVDYLKVDDLSFPYYATEIEAYRRAIDGCGRPMVFSTSPGATALEHAGHIARHASLWRICADFWDDWDALLPQFQRFADWTPHRRPGAWPDGDMLPLGRIGLRGPVGEPRYSRFTRDEQRTLMTLWAIGRSPLMMGGHLPDTDPFTWSLLTNAAVLRVNQYGTEEGQVRRDGDEIVWQSRDAENGARYFALFNIGDAPREVTADLGKRPMAPWRIRDCWAGGNVAVSDGVLRAEVPSHGAALFAVEAASSEA